MKKILLAIIILFAFQASAQLIKRIPGDKEISKRSSSYTIWTEGSFFEMNDSLFYIFMSRGHVDYVYVSIIENNNIIILDSIASTATYSSREPSRNAPVNNFPSAVASGDTIFIATSFEVYKWRNKFIDTEHPKVPIMGLSVDQHGKVYACGSKEAFSYNNGNWDSAKYSTSRNLRKIEHLGDTIILSNIVGVEFLVNGVVNETITEARRIKNISGYIYYLNHTDGYIYKRESKGNYTSYSGSIYNSFYDCLDFEIYNGLLWITAKKFEGDPSFKLYYLKEGDWYQASDIDISYIKNINKKLYLQGRYTYTLAEFGFIKGNNYFDIDENCFFNTNDKKVSDYIYINDNAKVNSPNGKYSILVESGADYSISARSPQGTNRFKCLSESFNITNAQNNITYTHDFKHELDTSITDLELTLSSSLAIRGFRYNGSIKLENKNLNKYESIKVKLVNLDNLSDFNSDSNFIQNGNTFEFTLPSLKRFDQINIPFSFRIDTANFNLGDTTCLTASVFVSDSIKSNNMDKVSKVVRGAYDPNMKTSFPSGAITKLVDKIDYTIQFQNMGTHHATNVRVVDTLDTRLPIEYIRVKGTSHPETYSLEVRNNVLIWTFSGIDLPDSTSDPEGSKGYICYEAKVNSAFLKQGDQIDNKAEIYFDYEKPIVTNFASVYLNDTSTTSIFDHSDPDNTNPLLCYPNPSNGRFTIENNTDSPTDIEIYNLYGALILRSKLDAYESTQISLDDVANGMYLVRNEIGRTIKLIKN